MTIFPGEGSESGGDYCGGRSSSGSFRNSEGRGARKSSTGKSDPSSIQLGLYLSTGQNGQNPIPRPHGITVRPLRDPWQNSRLETGGRCPVDPSSSGFSYTVTIIWVPKRWCHNRHLPPFWIVVCDTRNRTSFGVKLPTGIGAKRIRQSQTLKSFPSVESEYS